MDRRVHRHAMSALLSRMLPIVLVAAVGSAAWAGQRDAVWARKVGKNSLRVYKREPAMISVAGNKFYTQRLYTRDHSIVLRDIRSTAADSIGSKRGIGIDRHHVDIFHRSDGIVGTVPGAVLVSSVHKAGFYDNGFRRTCKVDGSGVGKVHV